MPGKPKAKAVWSVDMKNSSMTTDKDGTFHISAVVLDTGVKSLTFDLTITPDRAAKLVTALEPDANLTDYQAWSNR